MKTVSTTADLSANVLGATIVDCNYVTDSDNEVMTLTLSNGKALTVNSRAIGSDPDFSNLLIEV